MTTRTAARLAWFLAALAIVATLGEITLLELGRGLPFNAADQTAAIDFLESFLFPIVGALIAWKQPRNPVGWLLLAYSLADAVAGLMTAYAEHGVLTDPGSLPAAGAAMWVSLWTWVVYLNLIPQLLLRFPSGSLPSNRWRWVPWMSVVPVVIFTAPAIALLDVPARQLRTYWETGVSGYEWTRTFAIGALVALVSVLLAALISLVYRYRRSSIQERQQLKWVMLAVVVMMISAFLDFLPGPPDLKAAFSAIAFASLPIAIGIAILRYRLYDIDIIINRALVYGALTALLVLVYVGGVVVLGGAFRELTNQQDNNLAVAASTLAVAALVRPARARIQGFIDRRFYRKKYDAAQTLESFSARLRDEVDLDELSLDLLTAIRETMQPAHASLWLRSGAER
jgi:hypothetical protein